MLINYFNRVFLFKRLKNCCIFQSNVRIRCTLFKKRQDSQLVTMKIDTPYFHGIFTHEVRTLSDLFLRYGFGLRMAGGAVRDLLMDKQPDDIDFATTATPEEMIKMFHTEGIRMLHRKGEAHGTVTIRLNDKQNFEITTLRIDTTTDGRHAEVRFTTDWELDAGRRDLTINAMFLGLDGTLYDYFNGREDLQNRHVRFVGDPDGRIQEDYLRILRYFRFYGRIARQPDAHDPDTLKAIQKNVEGLGKISGERIWMELKKILIGTFSKEIMIKMVELGISSSIGLPENPDVTEFKDVCDRAQGMKLLPVTKLTALLKTEQEVMNLHSRLKFSKYERDLALFLTSYRNLTGHPPLKPFISLIMHSKNKITDTHEWCCEVLKYNGEVSLWKELSDWKIPKFPISGHILMEKGYKPGPKMTKAMSSMKDAWIDSNFKMSKTDLLDYLDKNVQGDGL